MTWLSAKEASSALGISPATLYAYVSRGLVRSESGGQDRRKRYRREDIEALKQRRMERTQPQQALAQALHFGSPLCDSALTLISDGRLYYRGQDACQLAVTHSLEEVAALLWECEWEEPNPRPVARAHSLLAVCSALAAEDLGSYDLRAGCVQRTGMRILRSLTCALSGEWGACAESLARGWSCSRPDLISVALVLSADHELNVSAFTARCVASSGASPWAVVTAGLAAMEGHRHGGMTLRVEALLQESATRGPRQALADRLKRGEGTPGFGHVLYPGGDPRGRLLLDSLPNGEGREQVAALEACALELLGERASVDLGLVALTHCLELPRGSALVIFSLGRIVGWIAHALERSSSGHLIRPRARYVGPLPG